MGEMGRGPDGPVTVLAQRGNLGLRGEPSQSAGGIRGVGD